MSNEYKAAVAQARQALDMRSTYHGVKDANLYVQAEATRAVAYSILALAAALRPEPVEVNVKVDAVDATAAAEEVVRRGQGERRVWLP